MLRELCSPHTMSLRRAAPYLGASGQDDRESVMARISAGILLVRRSPAALQLLLVHPGGPFWARKDDGAWSIPKGEPKPGEDPLAAAKREFQEETGGVVPEGTPIPLAPVRQPGGKIVHAFAIEGDFDVATLKSNTFTMEWPPRSGRQKAFPEADRAAWFTMEVAGTKIVKGHTPLPDQPQENPGCPSRTPPSSPPRPSAGAPRT